MKRLFIALFTLSLFHSFTSTAQNFGFGGNQQSDRKAQYSEKYTDINYAGDTCGFHTLDVYIPNSLPNNGRAGVGLYPVVVHIYGSAWFANNAKGWADINTICAALLDAGYAVVCPNHRSSNDAKYPAQIQDIKAVIRWIRGNAKKYHFDTSFIGTSGFSSGAHLASLCAVTNGVKKAKSGNVVMDIEGSLGNYTNESSYVNACCEWSGPIDMMQMDCDGIKKQHPAPEDNLMGFPYQGHEDSYNLLTPIYYLNSKTVPIFVNHGEADNVVPHCQGELFYNALKAANVKGAQYHSQPEGGHGFKMYTPENLSEMVKFFDKARGYIPYQNPQLSAHERAVDLCSRLTLEEKASLMLDDSPAIPRLGIKRWQWWSEALHGYANMGHVTNFPEPIGMAASFNDAMVNRVFDAVSTEARAKWNELQKNGGDVTRFHALSVWTPNVNIFRDPRWGRGQETYGEDPYLTGRMGSAVVRGLQGPEDAKYRKLWACAKHYAVHSGPEWSRHVADIDNISARDLWETYLPAFKTVVEDAKVREVMCAYQRYDNEPCCSNTRLLQQILRDEWGFKYLVVSDCGAVTDIHSSHKVASDATHSAARATLAGTDVECGFNYAYKSIPEAVHRGLISEEEVNKHVIRLLEGRFDLGEMDDPSLVPWSKIPSSVLESKEHLQLALDMARQSIVLLQNGNAVLPLDKNEKIAVIGPNADNKPMMWGNYNGTPTTTVTILDGIRKENKNVKYIQGCDLTDDKIVTDLFSQCSFEGKKGMKGTFWNNAKREGKPVTTAYYTTPFFKTTAGNYQFAPGVNLTDFSAQYETVFKPTKSGEVVIKVEAVSKFDVIVGGDTLQKHNTWRVTPTRTPLQVEAGKEYNIQIHFAHVPTWGASIRVNLGTESKIDYKQIIDKQLAGIKKVVFVGGISPSLEGEEMPVMIDGFKGGDRTNIELPKVQREFIRALHDAGKQIIYVNCSGSAIALQPESEVCDAIVQAWYPGMQGGTAVADVLFGKVNPSGKLPVTFYATSSQLRDFEDYNMEGRTYRYIRDFKPLYPFGYGLSYTQFNIGKAGLSGQAENSGYILTVPIRNIGKRDGTEVVQVYVRNPQDPKGPVMQLRGYQRVDVKAGQTANATITLNRKSFEWFDEASNTVRTIPGKYEILYGNSSRPEDLKSIDIEIQ